MAIRETRVPVSDPLAAEIWVVDDSPLQIALARSILEPRHVLQEFGGAAAMLERLSTGERPDLLMLDWHMPDVSGLEACCFVRELVDEAQLPIIMLTSTTEPKALLKALAAGANDFLRKPVEPVELEARVHTLLRTKRLHAQLALAERGHREEAQFREQFLAILAHDLRQPLNVVSLGGHTLAGPDIPPAVRQRAAKQLLRAAERMQRMISELLDFSRSRPTGAMPITRANVDLAAVVRQVVEEIRLVQGEAAVQLDECGECYGSFDGDRLAQVVSNLVENAISYRTPGTPVLVALRTDEGRIRLIVENHGEPIPDEVMPLLFDAFRRGGREGSTGGLGLGLYIASQIVTAHGGTLSATSTDGMIRFEAALSVTAPRVES